MAKKMPEKEPEFEELLADAEALAERMEEGGITLDESIKAYEKGVDNLRRCAELLRGAEERVKVLLEQNGAFRLEDLDGESDSRDDDDDSGDEY